MGQVMSASSLNEVKEALKDHSELNPERAWEEIDRHRSTGTEKLDLNELDSLNGAMTAIG